MMDPDRPLTKKKEQPLTLEEQVERDRIEIQRRIDCQEGRREQQRRADRIGAAFWLPGLALVGISAILPFSTRRKIDDGDGGGKNCTTGKPCGNTCIEVSDVCRVGQGAAKYDYNEKAIAASVAMGVAGVIFVLGFVVPQRLVRPVTCTTAGCALTLRF